ILDNIQLEGPKKCWSSCCVQDENLWWHGHAITIPSVTPFPRYDCFEGTWSRKMRFSLLSKLYLNRPQMRANVFHSRCGKDFNGAVARGNHINPPHATWMAFIEKRIDIQRLVQSSTSSKVMILVIELVIWVNILILSDKFKYFVTHLRQNCINNNSVAIDTLHSCHLEAPKIKNLPKNVIDIKVLKALNKSTRTEGPIITSVEFHPSSTVALVAGTSGVLSLFQVDGHTNNKLHSMQFKKYPISKAIFMKEGTEILLGSQYYPYCHTYDLMNGKTYKFSLPHRITNMKRYEVSPDGKLIALCGRLGEIYLLHSFTKELVGTFRMNSKCRVLAFTPDSKTLISHGGKYKLFFLIIHIVDGSEMYIWDLNTRTCINRAIDDGSLSCTSLAVSPSGQFVATGSAQGVVNLYDMKTVLEDQSPAPLKIWMNLVTSVTSLKFNLTSEILTAASVDKYNAFRMMHLPSFTVFSNFPTLQTNIGMSQTINFSPGSGYLSISNRTGSALLYRLRHYGNY
ncbi:UTP18 protein, partial [Acromyrmex charruanus]